MYVYSPWQLLDLEELTPFLDRIDGSEAGEKFREQYASLPAVKERVYGVKTCVVPVNWGFVAGSGCSLVFIDHAAEDTVAADW